MSLNQIIKHNNYTEIITINNETIKINNTDSKNVIVVGSVGGTNFTSYTFNEVNNNIFSYSLLELKNILNTSNNLIIMGIRNPIERNLSYFYQLYEIQFFTTFIKTKKNNYEGRNIDLISKITSISNEEAINRYFNMDIHTDFNDWFEELFEITGINQKTFNKDAGLDFYNLPNNNKIMLYTVEKLDSNIENIKNILNLTEFINSNSSQYCFYKDHYNTTKSQITYTQSYLDSQLNTDIMKFFYSDEDIQGFYNKYTVQN